MKYDLKQFRTIRHGKSINMKTFIYLGSYTGGYELAICGGNQYWRWIGETNADWKKGQPRYIYYV